MSGTSPKLLFVCHEYFTLIIEPRDLHNQMFSENPKIEKIQF